MSDCTRPTLRRRSTLTSAMATTISDPKTLTHAVLASSARKSDRGVAAEGQRHHRGDDHAGKVEEPRGDSREVGVAETPVEERHQAALGRVPNANLVIA